MKLQFKHQQFQADAAAAVVDLFKGMPRSTRDYIFDRGEDKKGDLKVDSEQAFGNMSWDRFVAPEVIASRIKALQQQHFLPASNEGELQYSAGNPLNLTIEMETGVGKTYTYIKTIYELNRAYGWSKFIVVVPSIAVREGVYKSFAVTQEHFALEYPQQALHYFVYNSAQLSEIDSFARDNDVQVMIINAQAFNSQNQDARIITTVSDSFQSRAPIDVIKATNPIVILDEPQSIEGNKTKEALKLFNPLLILRYSATHRTIQNMVYRLDAQDAYNQLLVKRIAVKGIAVQGSNASRGYVFVQDVIPTKQGPMATISFEQKSKKTGRVKMVTRQVYCPTKSMPGFNLYENSNGLAEYQDGFVISDIVCAQERHDDSLADASAQDVATSVADEAEVLLQPQYADDDSSATAAAATATGAAVRGRGARRSSESYVEFENHLRLYVGEVNCAQADEDLLRKLQIQETIRTHFERERQLFPHGIKVLTLFFIDKVSNYREYDDKGNALAGKYAQMFEKAYKECLEAEIRDLEEQNLDDYWTEYCTYLKSISACATHAGYFSVDKKGRMAEGKIAKSTMSSDDVDAYDLIMKDKERLLDLDPQRSPVRFIFSHSALREGWDNPNVFQICTLRDDNVGKSTIRKRQEVGRGMRLCVDKTGRRQDVSIWGKQVQDINVLTVIASESYEQFAASLQHEILDDLKSRPQLINAGVLSGLKLKDSKGHDVTLDRKQAQELQAALQSVGFIDAEGKLTAAYYTAQDNDAVASTLAQKWLPVEEHHIAPNDTSVEADTIRAQQDELVSRDPWRDCIGSVVSLLGNVFNPRAFKPADARKSFPNSINQEQFESAHFRKLWDLISFKSTYAVRLSREKLIAAAIKRLDADLNVDVVKLAVTRGQLQEITKDRLKVGNAFSEGKTTYHNYDELSRYHNQAKFDLVGALVEKTFLIRKDIIAILQGIKRETFDKFKQSPEEFITRSADIINAVKGAEIVEGIEYQIQDERYDREAVFNARNQQSRLDLEGRVVDSKKGIYQYVRCDSEVERVFAQSLENTDNVAVYAKLPLDYFINTPLGHYTPDWAVAYIDGEDHIKKILFFVIETKGSVGMLNLRELEDSKIECARKHFAAVNDKLKVEQGHGLDVLEKSDMVQFTTASSLNDIISRVHSELRPDEAEQVTDGEQAQVQEQA